MKGTIIAQNLMKRLDTRMKSEVNEAGRVSGELRMQHQWKAAGLAEAIQILGQMTKEVQSTEAGQKGKQNG